MVSPELLRRYPCFSFMNHVQLREVSMITDEIEVEEGYELCQIGTKADTCYLLLEGAVDLHYVIADEFEPEVRKEFVVGTINPGDMLGISVYVEPYRYTATAVCVSDSRLLEIDGAAMRKLTSEDSDLGCGVQTMVAKAAMKRLQATLVQLAAATSPE